MFCFRQKRTISLNLTEQKETQHCSSAPPPSARLHFFMRTAGYSNLSMKTSWRGFAANTRAAENTCTWLRSLFWRRVAHCVDSRLVSQTHLCTCVHAHKYTVTDANVQPRSPTFWWRPLDGGPPSTSSSSSCCSRQLQQTQHAGSPVPVALATSHISADVPLIWSDFHSPPGFVCASVCGHVYISLYAPMCSWLNVDTQKLQETDAAFKLQSWCSSYLYESKQKHSRLFF